MPIALSESFVTINLTCPCRRHEFYELTQDMLHGHRRSDLGDRSETTSYVEGKSISRETLPNSDSMERNIMAQLLKRQDTRKHSLRRQNLYDIVDEGLRPIIDRIDEQNQNLAEGDAEEAATGGGEAAGGGQGDGPGRSADGEDEGRAAPTVPASLNWLRVRSLTAVMSLAQDPEKRKLVRTRTEQAKNRWKDTLKKVKPKPRPETFKDVVGRARRKNAEEGGGGGKDDSNNDDSDDDVDGQKERGAAKGPTVSFKVKNESPRRRGPVVSRSATAAGSGSTGPPKASNWGKARAATSLKTPRDRGATDAQTFRLSAVAEVHPSGSTGSPEKIPSSASRKTREESGMDEETSTVLQLLDDGIEATTQF